MQNVRDMRRSNNILKTGFFIFLFTPFFKPAFFSQLNIVDYLYSCGLIFAGLMTWILFLNSLKLRKTTIFFVVYQVFLLTTAYYNGIINSSVINLISTNIVICLAITYLIQYDTKHMLKGLTGLLSFWTIINLIMILIFPNGMRLNSWGAPIHFLEADNKLTPILILTMVISIVYSLFTYDKITKSSYFIILICSLTVIIVWPGTGVIALLVFLSTIILSANKKIIKKVNIKYYIGLAILLYLFVVVFRMQKYFSFFIESLLKKDMTLSNRTMIWDSAIEIINNSSFSQLLIGHGYEVRLLPINMMGTFYNTHSHNEILETLIQSGIIGLIMLIILIICAASQLLKYKHERITYIFIGAIFSFLVMGITERAFYLPFFLILILSFNIDIIVKQRSYNVKSK